jgi:hypothetical protein
MKSIPQIVANNWNTLVSIADKLDIGDGLQEIYFFRGQADADWSLKPSLHRSITNDGLKPLPSSEELLRVEKVLTKKFQEVASNYLPSATLNTTKGLIDWWPLMRHYGVPTRLLDWTASFYVALYFAVARCPEKDGSIYLVHAHTLKESMRAIHMDAAELSNSLSMSDREFQRPDAPAVIYLFKRSVALLDRMVSQQGIFMINTNIRADFEEILAEEIPKVADSSQETLRKIRINAAQKPSIMRRLRAMNINASSLFPGIEGIGGYLDELVRNR